MPQHFLLSRKARGLSLKQVFAMSDDVARETLAELRWGDNLAQTCPHCGVIRAHRYVKLQKRWRCKECYQPFSVTSGTVFHGHKLSLQTIIAGMLVYANAVKGLSALQLSRELDVQYKTAFVLLHKIRESLWKTQDTTPFEGDVEIDAAHVHRYVRPKNKKVDRLDRRLEENQNKLRCIVLVIRQRYPAQDEGEEGAMRTRVFVLKSENENDIRAVVEANVKRGSRIFTDEASGYASLGALYPHEVVCHEAEYQSDTGANQNQAESFFSRLRRMLMGQIHQYVRKHLDVYANEIAFREDWRRKSNRTFVMDALQKCLQCPRSRDWAKYWQGNNRKHDSVMDIPARTSASPAAG